MPKLPDFTELTKKFDIQGLLDSVKSAVGGNAAPAKAAEGDAIGTKFVEIINLTQELATAHAALAKAIANVSGKLNDLYKEVQALQTPVEAAVLTTPKATVTNESAAVVEPPPTVTDNNTEK